MIQPTRILSAAQTREADAYTIANEPVASIDLMERAAIHCTKWLVEHCDGKSFCIVCGLGNNGGDGLAIARLLKASGLNVSVGIVRYSEKTSADFRTSEEKLKAVGVSCVNISAPAHMDTMIIPGTVIIDAIFGTGLDKPVEGLVAACIERINQSGSQVVSIDMPSGLASDTYTDEHAVVVKASHTLTFHAPKQAFLYAQNSEQVGEFTVLDIGLLMPAVGEGEKQYYLDETYINSLLQSRTKFAHKGTFGHTLLVAGSYGKMGAAVLATKACLKSGAGLVTAHIPQSGYQVMQISCPEAMASVDKDVAAFSSKLEIESYTAVGIGPGLGVGLATRKALLPLLVHAGSSCVIDADALNIISLERNYLDVLPKGCILTPHPKEFERLTSKAANDFERHQLQIEFSKKYQVHILLKGAHSCLTTPEGDSYYNSTGNPGMAKGGTGDALTGLIAGLLAHGYVSRDAALIGMFLHGRAGDITAQKKGQEGMTAGDLIESIPDAYASLKLRKITA